MWDLGERAFRARLARELAEWRAEGLVDDATARALQARYAVDPDEGRGLATLAVYILGALLIGGGVLSLVAWNWEALPATAKLLLIGSVLTASHFYGFRMWRVDGSRPRLGHALTVLGTLLFGAGIGLVAQVFHVSGALHNGFLAWAAGAWIAALAYRSVPHALVSLGVAFIGWWGYADIAENVAPIVTYGFLAAFVPLAWRHRSRALFLLALVAWGIALPAAVGEAAESGAAVFVAVCAVAATLLAVPYVLPRTDFSDVSRFVGVAALVGVTYAVSFHDVADQLEGEWTGAALPWIAAALPLAFAAWGIVLALRQRDVRAPVSTAALFAVPVLLLASALGGVALAVVANVLLATIVAVAIYSAVHSLERGPFWMGALLGGALVVTRFLEFDTDLWIKALAFIAAGVSLLMVGVAFERRLKARPHDA